MKRSLVLFLALSCIIAYAQKKKSDSSDPWKGTYKLDLLQSKFSGTAPKEELVTVDSATKQSVKYTIQGTDAQGNSYTLSYDGKVGTPAPQMMNGKEVAQTTYQMPSPRKFTSAAKGADGTSSTGTVTLSPDNKTITVVEQLKDSKGASQEQKAVYVRQ